MDLCVLPQTGTGEQWLLLVAVAAIVIAAGIALAVSGRARRSVLTGLGALAIVGALVATGLGGAPAAQADAGSSHCVTAPARQAPAAAAIVATPGIPTTTAQCAAEPTVQVPTTQGVVYSQARTGSSVTVTATAAPGYVLLAGAVTSWTYDLTPTTRAPWPVDLPARTDATITFPDVSDDEQALYLDPSDLELVPSLQAAADAGALDYSLDGEGFAQTIPVVVLDDEGQELGLGEIVIRTPSDLSYDFERDLYVQTQREIDDPEGEFEAQIAALLAQFPGGVEVVPGGDVPYPFSIEFSGLRILASYEPGPGCATETAEVAIDVEFGFLPPESLATSSLSIPELDAAAPADEPAALQQAPVAPASEEPVVEEPVVDEPVVDEPVVDELVVEDPSIVVEP